MATWTTNREQLVKNNQDVLREGPKSGNNKEGASNLRDLMIQAVKEKEEKLRLVVQLEAQVRSVASSSAADQIAEVIAQRTEVIDIMKEGLKK